MNSVSPKRCCKPLWRWQRPRADCPSSACVCTLVRLRQVLPEALTFAFDALATGTLAQGATLIWEEIPPRVRCHACQAIFQPEEDWFWTCPRCGVAGGEVLEGDELVLQSVTVKMQ